MNSHGKAGDRKAKRNHERLVISLCHVATPDAEVRLARAASILLKAATKGTSGIKGDKDHSTE